MATITFSSPLMEKDITVYAIVGDTQQSILKLAKKYKIPLPFECEDGECGSCVVHVTSLENKPRMSQALTEKERHTLVAEGLITKQELKDAEINDMPPAYRLACQFIPRDEEILVRFSGEPGVGI
ncbi:MAG: 2Fe-2S iron-sulfur cluster binding domain-containing protein [Hydrogenophilales bacterium]|nr:2Fe-2S iron-sulfur cluster binding domain-containing protein [Hydrogenophilales bacterium]